MSLEEGERGDRAPGLLSDLILYSLGADQREALRSPTFGCFALPIRKVLTFAFAPLQESRLSRAFGLLALIAAFSNPRMIRKPGFVSNTA